jgi:hypothetical protein
MSEELERDLDETGRTSPAQPSHPEMTQSYLLRLWRGSGDSGVRASLQSVRTGERRMFADLESLLAFLCDQLRAS